MLNIKKFWPVVKKKKSFQDLSKLFLFCPLMGLKRVQFLYFNKAESHPLIICPTKFGWNWPSGFWQKVVYRKKLTLDGWQTLRHTICAYGLRQGELKVRILVYGNNSQLYEGEVKNIDIKQSNKGTIKLKIQKTRLTWNKETQMTGQHEPQ